MKMAARILIGIILAVIVAFTAIVVSLLAVSSDD